MALPVFKIKTEEQKHHKLLKSKQTDLKSNEELGKKPIDILQRRALSKVREASKRAEGMKRQLKYRWPIIRNFLICGRNVNGHFTCGEIQTNTRKIILALSKI